MFLRFSLNYLCGKIRIFLGIAVVCGVVGLFVMCHFGEICWIYYNLVDIKLEFNRFLKVGVRKKNI